MAVPGFTVAGAKGKVTSMDVRGRLKTMMMKGRADGFPLATPGRGATGDAVHDGEYEDAYSLRVEERVGRTTSLRHLFDH